MSPMLDEQAAGEVDEAEVQDFSPVDPGVYPAMLIGVEAKEGKKAPYWNWEFHVIPGHELAGRRFWAITSLSEKSRFKLKEMFDAFGVASTTDTDELCGCVVNLQVGIRTIQEGDRTGQKANQVEQVLAYEPEEGEGGDDEEPF